MKELHTIISEFLNTERLFPRLTPSFAGIGPTRYFMSGPNSNTFVEKYDEYEQNLETTKQKVLRALSLVPEFVLTSPEEKLSSLYTTDKITSAVLEGDYRGTSSLMKLQFIETPQNEAHIIDQFNQQSTSSIVHLPENLFYIPFDKQLGASILVTKSVVGSPLYEDASSPQAVTAFTDFYDEYRTHCLNKAFFPPATGEDDISMFCKKRAESWSNIADKNHALTKEVVEMRDAFLSLIDKTSLPMEFVHGHLTKDNILVQDDGQITLFANLYWSYRPQFYDSVFHLWHFLKDSAETISPKDGLRFLEMWENAYIELSSIGSIDAFRRAFRLMMMERSIGTLLADIPANAWDKERKEKAYELFRGIFDVYARSL